MLLKARTIGDDNGFQCCHGNTIQVILYHFKKKEIQFVLCYDF